MLPNQKDLKLFLRLSLIIRSEIKFNLLQITLDFSKESSFWSWKQILILEKYLKFVKSKYYIWNLDLFWWNMCRKQKV